MLITCTWISIWSIRTRSTHLYIHQDECVNMRVRKHENTLAASLFDLNIPTDVFYNLIETFKKNLPVWHRYFAIRRKVLGLKSLAYYDMSASLTKKKVKVPYEKGVEMICDSLAPMGKDYVETVRRGSLKERWVDVYPNQGKAEGAFSWGSQGTHPFIMMSYTDEVTSMSTLAHELGHSMPLSYLTSAVYLHRLFLVRC